MTWEMPLIKIYFLVCEHKDVVLSHHIRHSNNYRPAFTDEELMTIYLFCSFDGLKLQTKREVYNYADRHLRSWFPLLPKYEAFSQRLNALSACFKFLTELLAPRLYTNALSNQGGKVELLLDSLPIILAKRQRACCGKVAPECASVGFCATKKLSYYGFKLHLAGVMSESKSLPSLYSYSITKASTHDARAFKEDIATNAIGCIFYADSAYVDETAKEELKRLYDVTVEPIQKRKKGQAELFYDQKCQNTEISKIRQPIEGYFNWLIHHTDIQNASKCRSLKGVLLHIFGKIAAAVVSAIIFNS